MRVKIVGESITILEDMMSFTEPTTTELQTIYNNGCDAYYANVPYSGNPYKKGLRDARIQYAWDNGWVDSAKEDGHNWNVAENGIEQRWSA